MGIADILYTHVFKNSFHKYHVYIDLTIRSMNQKYVYSLYM